MKLRIKGDSLRLRISPSEVERLLQTGRIEEAIHFGPQPEARLAYAVELSAPGDDVTVRYEHGEILVLVPPSAAQGWAQGSETGIYGSVALDHGTLEVAVEKDFACLDGSDAENRDTFPHPHHGQKC